MVLAMIAGLEAILWASHTATEAARLQITHYCVQFYMDLGILNSNPHPSSTLPSGHLHDPTLFMRWGLSLSWNSPSCPGRLTSEPQEFSASPKLGLQHTHTTEPGLFLNVVFAAGSQVLMLVQQAHYQMTNSTVPTVDNSVLTDTSEKSIHQGGDKWSHNLYALLLNRMALCSPG